MANDIFERKEIKYLLSNEQYLTIMDYVNSHMEPDKYGKSKSVAVSKYKLWIVLLPYLSGSIWLLTYGT